MGFQLAATLQLPPLMFVQAIAAACALRLVMTSDASVTSKQLTDRNLFFCRAAVLDAARVTENWWSV